MALAAGCSPQEPPTQARTPVEAAHARLARERSAFAQQRALHHIQHFLDQPEESVLAVQARPFLKENNIVIERAADHPERVKAFQEFSYDRSVVQGLNWARIVFGTLRCGYGGMTISVAMDERTSDLKAVAVYPEK